MRRTAVAVIVVSAFVAPLGCTKAKPTKETFCRELRRTTSFAEVLGGLQSDDPSTIARRAKETAQQFARLERSAPREIRSDVTEISNLVDKVAKVVEDSPGDPQAIAAALRGQALNSARVLPAGFKLIDYSRNECKYDPTQSSGVSPSTTTPDSSVPATPTT